jgi:hypothetical protein
MMMKQIAKLLMSLIVIQLLLVFVAVVPAFAEGASFVSGSVFVDNNQNTIAEPGETSVAHATVHVRAHTNPAIEYTVQTDASGYYLVSNLPYGVYSVWAESATQSAVAVATIELGEVNATVALDLPVVDNSADVELTKIEQMYLPLVVQ